MSGGEYHRTVKFGTPSENSGTNYVVDHRTDLGIQIGGGVTLFQKIIVDACYGYGLSNLDDANMWGYQEKRRNRTFQLTLGVPLLMYKSPAGKS
jgi:hypothetical protein